MESKKNNEKIIVFSELDKIQKIKYFNFFIDNEIEFQKEEGGTYITEIEVIDPNPKKKEDEETKDNEDNDKSARKSNKKEITQLYSTIYDIIQPSKTTKSSKMNLNSLKLQIETIYTQKFIEDTKFIPSNPDEDLIPFDEFVAHYFMNKYKRKKQVVDQMIVSFLTSIEFYKKNYDEIKLFSQFLTEEYDADDLIYFLFVRSCIEKELGQQYVSKAQESVQRGKEKLDTELYLQKSNIKSLALKIFGKNDQKNIQNFEKKMVDLFDQIPEDIQKKVLPSKVILLAEVDEYHKKIDDEEEQKISVFNENEQKNVTPIKNDNEANKNGDEDDHKEEPKENLNEENNEENNDEVEDVSEEFQKILKANKIETCKNPKDQNNCLRNIIQDYYKQMKLGNYLQKLINFKKELKKVDVLLFKNSEKIKKEIQKKFNMVNLCIFNNDLNKFLMSLNIQKSGNIATEKCFQSAKQLITQMLNKTPFHALSEKLVNDYTELINSNSSYMNSLAITVKKMI